MDLDRLLPPELLTRLGLAPAALQDAVRRVASDDGATRVTGLDALQRALVEDGRLARGAPEAAPFVIALAAAPSWSAAGAVLLRLGRVLATVDEPPRSLAGDAGSSRARETYDRLEPHVPRLLRVATAGGDPARARLAACVAARFPSHDAAVEPTLLALLSGAPDEEERARLLYALARVQASRGAAAPGGRLHRQIAEALGAPPSDPARFAVLLALASHDPPSPLRERCANALREAIADPRPDPRAFGRQTDPASLRRALGVIAP